MMNLINFKTVVERWALDKRPYVKQSTFAAYSLIIENHLLPFFGEYVEITEDMVQDFVLMKLAKGLSQKSVKDMIVVLKMVFRFGVKNGYWVHKEISVRFPIEHSKQEVEVFTRIDQRKIMDYVKGEFSYKNLGIFICLSAGLRIGEVCALTWNDIDVKNESITVCKTIQRVCFSKVDEKGTKLIVDTPKTNNSFRVIPMSKELLKLVRPIKKVCRGSYYVLTNSVNPTEPRTYRNYYKKLLTKIGVPILKFHCLRHSFATRCIESKCDYKTVSVLLGHSNISTTLNLYVHPNMEQKKRCIEQMCRALG